MSTPIAPRPEPWLLHFFQRHPEDDSSETVPALDCFEGWPEKVVAEVRAVLAAVAEAPPPAFSGGGKWIAMHGDMAGHYEVRVRGNPAGTLYRVFCLLDRGGDLNAPPGAGSIVILCGASKQPGQQFSTTEYAVVKSHAAEFLRRRTVLA